MRLAWAIVLALAAGGQNLPQESGTVTVPGRCTAEMLQSLSLSCTESEPCPLYLELAAAEAVGDRIIVTGNIHTGSATLESVLLVSDDRGATWTEGHARIPSAVLDQIQFLDIEAGWINGHVLQPGPRDPFFLLTTDGGKTWRKRPISGESRTGAVEQFWFDSRNHGLLTIDRVRATDSGLRYEMWESMTGGAGWSIRQVHHEPLKLNRPPSVELWRIRADGAAHVHRLEKRSNAEWSTVAKFSVSAGECKPPEPERIEVPPPSVEVLQSEEPAAPQPRSRKPPSLKRPSP